MEEDQYLAGLIGEKGGDEELSVNEVKRLPVALRRRVVHQWLVGQGVGGVGFEEVGRVLSLIAENAAVAKINLPGGRHARRRAGRLFLE
ncbi:MAG: TilS substrate-binding domain-containing protein [Verrucomicrobiota bacterium]